MNARKDDILPSKTINAIENHKKAIKGHKRPYKNTLGHTKAIKPYGAI